MNDVRYSCSKCSGQTTKGFVVERSESSYNLVRWIEGEPEKRKLLGMTLADVEIDGRRSFNIRAMRCEQCGYLENYAV